MHLHDNVNIGGQAVQGSRIHHVVEWPDAGRKIRRLFGRMGETNLECGLYWCDGLYLRCRAPKKRNAIQRWLSKPYADVRPGKRQNS